MTGLAVRFVGLRRGARGAWGWGSLILMIIKYRRTGTARPLFLTRDLRL